MSLGEGGIGYPRTFKNWQTSAPIYSGAFDLIFSKVDFSK